MIMKAGGNWRPHPVSARFLHDEHLPRLHKESVADTALEMGICHTFYGFPWKAST